MHYLLVLSNYNKISLRKNNFVLTTQAMLASFPKVFFKLWTSKNTLNTFHTLFYFEQVNTGWEDATNSLSDSIICLVTHLIWQITHNHLIRNEHSSISKKWFDQEPRGYNRAGQIAHPMAIESKKPLPCYFVFYKKKKRNLQVFIRIGKAMKKISEFQTFSLTFACLW